MFKRSFFRLSGHATISAGGTAECRYCRIIPRFRAELKNHLRFAISLCGIKDLLHVLHQGIRSATIAKLRATSSSTRTRSTRSTTSTAHKLAGPAIELAFVAGIREDNFSLTSPGCLGPASGWTNLAYLPLQHLDQHQHQHLLHRQIVMPSPQDEGC
jgi:hypothetical protein